MKIKIEGVKELDIKITRFNNFLGKKYNEAMREIGEYGKKKFREHITKHRTMSGIGYKTTTDLKESYKEIKEKKWGYIYPILYASGKMFNDLKYFTGLKQRDLKTKRMKLSWGFKTQRSAEIALNHIKGVVRKIKGGYRKVKRDPWFLSISERGWIGKLLRRKTKEALRAARLKT